MTKENTSRGHRVTIRDIAREAGVSPASVSHAFRGDHHVSPQTRQRILETADRLGYRPHPMVSALMSEIRRNKVVEGETVLAMVDFFKDTARMRHTSRKLIFEGAAKRALELGYRLDLFEPAQEGWKMDRLAKILRTRGINGIIVPPLPSQPDLPPDFPWEDFSVVTVGYVCRSHAFHSVLPDQLAGMELALNELSKRGYHRVGLFISAEHDRRVRHSWSGLYHWHWAAREMKAPGKLLHFYETPTAQQGFTDWVKSEKPEVVITDFGVNWKTLQAETPHHTVGVINLICNAPDSECCGINQNYAQEGAAAIELMSTQLYRNERGPPTFRMNVQISPTWVEGRSLPPLS